MTTDSKETQDLESVLRISKELRESMKTVSQAEARFFVDLYYQIQDYRIQAGNQVSATERGEDESSGLVAWLQDNMLRLEGDCKRLLDVYSDSKAVGRWSKSICGIGPVIAAGLLAHIDIEKAPTVGHIWRFAGLDPTSDWGKGEKRPWNARLKTLCWKIGESFVKVSNNPKDVYGHLWRERKETEEKRNEAGELADQAAVKLRDNKIGKDTDAYKAYAQGKLPPAHIHARAKRWAVKLFLAHWHEVAYMDRFGIKPPAPYPIAILGHAHIIEAPGIVEKPA